MANAMNDLNPKEYIITRKRKRYKFALFHNNPLCFELEQWQPEFIPAILEIGAGTGTFSEALAENSPDTLHLAVDVKADRLQTGARKAMEKALTNVRFLRARVEQLAEIIPPHSISTIWITFPDPFPKDRSSKHRLTHPTYLNLYRTLLRPNGRVCFKTDAVVLFDWSLEQFADAGWNIKEISFNLGASTLEGDMRIPTTYELRYLKEGKKINYVEVEPPEDSRDIV